MKIAPPYPKYRYFREDVFSQHGFCPETLIDLSILVYYDFATIIKKQPLSIRLVDFIDIEHTQVLVVEDWHTSDLAVVFRGTETFNPADWATDFDCDMKGGIHRGFLKAYLDVDYKLSRYTKHRTVYFAGHSLGGALATIAAVYSASSRLANLVTFGSPRVGDMQFVKAVRDGTMICKRYVHGSDMVPGLPMESMGYTHVCSPTWLEPMPRPLINFLTPRPVFDHVPTNYAERIWQ